MSDFVHLHVHTQYSLLDGACRIDKLIPRVKELGQTAIAITDHGVMYGAIEFYKKAKALGIKPIIGCEVYVAPRTMQDKVHRIDSSPFHLVLLCKNETGYKNLISLVSKGSIDGFYQKPRVDMALLAKKSEGLIALSACLSGQLPRLLVAGQYEEAKEAAKAHIEIFGRENYFIEVQNHGIKEQEQILPLLRSLARELNVGLVATNDAHYITKSDSKIQHVLTCIQTNTTVDNSSLEFATDEFYIKSRHEMEEALPRFKEAMDNTVKIADMCNLEFEFGKLKLPFFQIENVDDNQKYFRDKCYEGLHLHYGENPNAAIVERLEYELDTIEKTGYVDYFLIVADFVSYAKKVDIPVGPGRGSGAGSLCAYCIGITGIDPLKYNLIFERFLNPERISMPDFDIDFCYVRRGEVIDYVIDRYGEDHVAQIITFGTMAARAAIRDVGRALGMSYQIVDSVAKAVPGELGITLDKALASSGDFKRLYDSDPAISDLIDTARGLEGMPRHASTHAAGVVITRDPVDSYVPLQKSEDGIVTQFPMGTLEELGLLKMDFLGLRNLTVIKDCERLINKHTPDFCADKIDYDDKKVYKMFSQGLTEGVFQFESSGMKQVLTQLKPEHMEDIIAVISLYRPGPMDSIPTYVRNRHNPSLVTYKHPKLKPILDVTYGCIVYQEQVMQIFRELAGFSYGRADLVRRAMSKKKADIMEKEREHFINGLRDEQGHEECPGCVKNGIPKEIANEIFDDMSSFAMYAFNKSHAAAYAHISYATAYLKCYYPKEYMSALLTSILDNTDKMVRYFNECDRLGIPILPPDVNESNQDFSPVKDGIRFGLLAVKNLGKGVVNAIVERRSESPYTGLWDFCSRLYSGDLRRKPLESLVKSGSLDSFGFNRRTMLEGVDIMLDNVERTAKDNLSGQLNLFGGEQNDETFSLTVKEEFPDAVLLAMEKDVLGLFVSGHPLKKYAQFIKDLGAQPISALVPDSENPQLAAHQTQRISLPCIVTARKNLTTKKGETMAFVTVEDLTGSLETLAFPKIISNFSPLLQVDAILLLSGRMSYNEEETKLIIEDVIPIEQAQEKAKTFVQTQKSFQKRWGLYIKVPSQNDEKWVQIRELLQKHLGNCPLYIYLLDSKTLTLAPKELWVNKDDFVMSALSDILGENNVAFKDR